MLARYLGSIVRIQSTSFSILRCVIPVVWYNNNIINVLTKYSDIHVYYIVHSPDLSRELGSGVDAPEWHYPTQTCTIPQNVPSVQHATGALPLTSQPPHDKIAFLEVNIPIGTTCASYYYS